MIFVTSAEKRGIFWFN